MIVINPDKCDLCGTCVSVCPVDCMEITEQYLVIDDQTCNLCEICVKVCPLKALSLSTGGEER